MKISKENLEKLINSLPAIEVELEFEDCEGHLSEEDYEFEADEYIVSIDFGVYESGSICHGDYLTPASFISSGKIAFVSNINVFDSEAEQYISFTDEQQITLVKEIESIIENQ